MQYLSTYPSSPHTIIIDVGAGMWKEYQRLLQSSNNFYIISFEPHPKLYQNIYDMKMRWEKNNDSIKQRFKLNNTAVSNKTKQNIKFYLTNDPVASNLYPLDKNGVREWKYPFNRNLFSIKDTINVDCITLTDYIKKHDFLKKRFVDLLNIDVQGTSIQVLDGISDKLFSKIKRIIVKCIDTHFELYLNQSNIVDVIDKLTVNGFTLIKGMSYSRTQERILEFVNTRFKPTQGELNPTFRIIETGELIIDVNIK